MLHRNLKDWVVSIRLSKRDPFIRRVLRLTKKTGRPVGPTILDLAKKGMESFSPLFPTALDFAIDIASREPINPSGCCRFCGVAVGRKAPPMPGRLTHDYDCIFSKAKVIANSAAREFADSTRGKG